MASDDGKGLVEVKSKFDAEFRRFTVSKSDYSTFEAFHELLSIVHLLKSNGGEPSIPFRIFYIDPKDHDLLPINNTDNYMRAMKTSRPLLRLVIQRQGECEETYYAGRRGGGGVQASLLTSMLHGGTPRGQHGKAGGISISQPSEFRQVAAIVDVDVVPETCRRVRLLKHGSDKPLGFYIRDGTSVRVTPAGLEKVPGIFISRLLAGGLAESTGLLSVNDEVLEVNGIEVAGKSLDQVTDMMVANSSNLIVTVKPANQRTIMSAGGPRRGSFSRNSNVSQGSMLSRSSTTSNVDSDSTRLGPPDYDHDDEDEIRDHVAAHNHHHQESLDVSKYGRMAPPSAKKPVLHL